MKPALTAPGTNLLTLAYDGLLSTFAFKFNLRRYSSGPSLKNTDSMKRLRSFLEDKEVGRCRFNR